MKYKITYEIDKDEILILTTMQNSINKMVKETSRMLIKTKDKAVREALIELGWTPPNED